MDYEEKRYELAKEILLKIINIEDLMHDNISYAVIKEVIRTTDEFINELKMTKP